MENREIARMLWETADLMEIAGEDGFRIRSYRNAASAIEGYPEAISAILKDPEKKVTDIPGIGKGIASALEETGTSYTSDASGGGEQCDHEPPNERERIDNRVAELELRLRERVEENTVLDREVRAFISEREVTREYIATLESAAVRLPAIEQALTIAESELKIARSQVEVFRNSMSRVLVDHLAVATQRYPVLYKFGRSFAGSMVPRLRSMVRRIK